MERRRWERRGGFCQGWHVNDENPASAGFFIAGRANSRQIERRLSVAHSASSQCFAGFQGGGHPPHMSIITG